MAYNNSSNINVGGIVIADGNGGFSGFSWSNTSGTVNASNNQGYYLTALTTITLPASPNDGDMCAFYIRTGATCTVTANTGQYIRIGTQFTALAGTITSNIFGSSVWLVYRGSDASWQATSVVGTWVVNEFTPASISNGYLWLDGNDPLNNGSTPGFGANFLPIDKFGVQTFTQATTSKRPTYTPSGINGKGVMTASSASTTSIQCTGANYGNDVSFFMVASPSTTTNSYLFGSSGGTQWPTFLSGFTVGTPRAYEWFNNTDRVNLASTATGYHVLGATQTTTGTQLVTYYDGTVISSGNYTQAINTVGLRNLFAATNTLNYYSGQIAEFIIYQQIVSPANQRLLNLYFQNKFAITMSGIN